MASNESGPDVVDGDGGCVNPGAAGPSEGAGQGSPQQQAAVVSGSAPHVAVAQPSGGTTEPAAAASSPQAPVEGGPASLASVGGGVPSEGADDAAAAAATRPSGLDDTTHQPSGAAPVGALAVDNSHADAATAVAESGGNADDTAEAIAVAAPAQVAAATTASTAATPAAEGTVVTSTPEAAATGGDDPTPAAEAEASAPAPSTPPASALPPPPSASAPPVPPSAAATPPSVAAAPTPPAPPVGTAGAANGNGSDNDRMAVNDRMLMPRMFPGSRPGSLHHTIDNKSLHLNLLLVFRHWDKSGDGKCDLAELQHGLHVCGYEESIEDIRRALRAVSHRSDATSYVTFEEFPKLLLRLHRGDTEKTWERVSALAEVEERRQAAEARAEAQAEAQASDSKDASNRPSAMVAIPPVNTNTDGLLSTPNVSKALMTPRRRRSKWSQFCTGPRIAVMCLLLWLVLGVTFYSQHNGWSLDKAFYYLVQSGLSIGFGALTEPDDTSKFVTIINVILGSSAIGGALAYFASSILESRSEWYEEVEADVNAKKRTTHTWRMWVEDHKRAMHIFAAFFAWLVVGIVFGAAHSNWSFITSMYFAVAAMSTGGLQAPDTDTLSMIFTGIYALLGVPLYGMALGTFAGLIVERYERDKLETALGASLTDKEFAYANKLGNSDGTIDFAEFVEMELLRLGKVDVRLLREISERFQYLDILGVGQITKETMHAGLMFEKLDDDNSGVLDREELSDIVQELSNALTFDPEPTQQELEAEYDAAMAREPLGVFTRLDFMLWLMDLQHSGRVRYTPSLQRKLQEL